MRRYWIPTLLFLTAAILTMSGCFGDLTAPSKENPRDPGNPGTSSPVPPRPAGLSAVVADREVSLFWTVSDTTHVDHYLVYRWEVEGGASEDFDLVESPSARTYVDNGVHNGQEYRYKVSAVNSAGLEGESSMELDVTPQIFGVAIEQGWPKVSSRNVMLSMSATAETQYMQISNDSGMTGAFWQPASSTAQWQLTAGDGVKTVYVRFRDSSDNESDIVSDDVILDTRAVISSVTEDTAGEELSAGDVIHFALDAGEPYGTAFVEIGNVVADIELYDDGTGGDGTAEDGIYERDYTVENWVECIAAEITGRFTDDVDNVAEPAIAPGTVTILDYPTPVVMDVPIPMSERRLSISWSQNNDSDFMEYKLYRSYVPGVDTSTQRELLFTSTGPSNTDFTDSGLEPDSTYYYAVYVVDDFGLSAISDEVAGTTLANEPPTPVELFAPWPADTAAIELSWTESEDDDFMAYEVMGWEEVPPDPPDPSAKRLVARITYRDDTFYTHEDLLEDVVYWYQIAVVDSYGARAYSESLSASPRPSSP